MIRIAYVSSHMYYILSSTPATLQPISGWHSDYDITYAQI